MEDLTGRYRQSLTAGESMSMGNTLDAPDAHRWAFGAPGVQSINPVPDRTDNVIDTAADAIPHGRTTLVGQDGTKPATRPDGGGIWRDVNDVAGPGGRWREE